MRNSSTLASAWSVKVRTAVWVGLSSVMVVSVTSRSFGAILGVMPRVLLLLPTETYRAKDFLAAAERLGVEVVVGCERRQALADVMGDRAVVVPLGNVDVAVEIIAALHGRRPLDAVLAVDDQGLAVAAAASARLGLTHNPVDAVAATRDKAALRARLAAAGGGPTRLPGGRAGPERGGRRGPDRLPVRGQTGVAVGEPRGHSGR